MEQRAGDRTYKRGRRRVRDALLTPQIIAIIGGTVVLIIVVMLGLTALEQAAGLRTNDIAVSFVLGVVVTAAVLVLVGVVAIYSGGVNWMTGARAERWTEELLRRLGPDWQVVHNLEFSVGGETETWIVDVDHVAVGPGGVIVIETKYSSAPVDLDAEHLSKQIRNDGDQVARNIRRVRDLFSDMRTPPPILGLVIYWGYRVSLPKDPILMLGRKTHVAMGADADRWLSTFTEMEPIDLQLQREARLRIERRRTGSFEAV